jgi:hypothetical protein
MTYYILAGSRPIRHYSLVEPDYVQIGKSIEECDGDIYEISSLENLSELLAQLMGWDDFVVIRPEDAVEIWKSLAKLSKK